MPDQIPTGSKSFQLLNPHLFQGLREHAATPKAVLVERDLHDEIEKYCRGRGYFYIHSRMDVPSTIQVGTPDFVIFMPGQRTVFLECKAKSGKTTTEQNTKLAHARKFGFPAGVVDNMEDARYAIENL